MSAGERSAPTMREVWAAREHRRWRAALVTAGLEQAPMGPELDADAEKCRARARQRRWKDDDLAFLVAVVWAKRLIAAGVSFEDAFKECHALAVRTVQAYRSQGQGEPQ